MLNSTFKKFINYRHQVLGLLIVFCMINVEAGQPSKSSGNNAGSVNDITIGTRKKPLRINTQFTQMLAKLLADEPVHTPTVTKLEKIFDAKNHAEHAYDLAREELRRSPEYKPAVDDLLFDGYFAVMGANNKEKWAKENEDYIACCALYADRLDFIARIFKKHEVAHYASMGIQLIDELRRDTPIVYNAFKSAFRISQRLRYPENK